MLKRYYDLLGEYKRYAIITTILILGECLFEVLVPLLVGKMLNVGLQHNVKNVMTIGGILLFTCCMSLLLGYKSAGLFAVVSNGFSRNLRRDTFYKIQEYSFDNIDKFSTASLITRLTTDVANVNKSFLLVLRFLIRMPLLLFGAAAMVFIISPKLSLIFCVALPIMIVIYCVLYKFIYEKNKLVIMNTDKINNTIQENLHNIRVVKSFVREEYENKKFNRVIERHKGLQFTSDLLAGLDYPFLQGIIFCCLVSIIYFGGNMVITKQLNLGELSSFLIYTFQILMSLAFISFVFMNLITSKVSIDRVNEVLDEKPTIKDKISDLKFKDGSIIYKDVNFSYSKGGNLVLKGINLEIKSGETIGIIGGTASGKSTLIQLLPRLYDITSGELFVGGNNVKDYDLFTLRNEIAVVLQKNVLFSGTIRDNLLWGNENATDEEIAVACRQAQAEEFILKFPDGYNTKLERGASNLSGGQRQRLCIARALLKKPKILIFDDSTSAVDTATDSRIRSFFKKELNDITKIIIAQRILSIKDADRIVVINDGMIDAVGDNSELLEKNKIYKEIYYSQQENSIEG